MRLTCPNCGAQYEVPESVLPTEGRDVQCSSCGKTWFQEHPDTIAERELDRQEAPHDDEEVVQVEPTPEVQETEDEPEMATEVPSFVPPEPAPAPGTGRRALDPAVTDVLREEAKRETHARESEVGVLESQPELGLSEAGDDAEKRAQEARERMAKMRGEAPATPPGNALGSSSGTDSRRDLLPDIEEINSTLRSNESRSPSDDPGQTAQIEVQEKRSSRRGFTLTIALVAILALIYAYAVPIAGAIPALEPSLAVYVSIVNDWRVWLDTQISTLLMWLDANAAGSGS